jgi:hypothetical protein
MVEDELNDRPRNDWSAGEDEIEATAAKRATEVPTDGIL